MTTTTKPAYNSLLDDRDITLFRSPTGLVHVGAWFGETVCRKFVYDSWTWMGLTSLRYIGRMSRRPQANHMCKSCAKEYKDVNVDA
jgi:hypothetical protein